MNIIKKLTSQKPLFYIGVLIKILLGSLLASKFLTDLFIPFVDYFVSSGFANPYEKFLNAGEVAHFPYPLLMLYVLAIPKMLLGWIAPESEFFRLFLSRLPLLVADISIFFILKSWLKEKYHSRLICFYWLSPVLIYISYIHGQLDVIPIAFLFGSLFYLFKDKFLYSGILLGCALATKTNIALVYPFFFLFLTSKNLSLKTIGSFFLAAFGVFTLINMPYMTDSAFFNMVFFNQEQSKLFNVLIPLNSLAVFLIPASLLILFVRGVLLKTYNRDIFIMFLGFAFSIILLFIPPMQGWYFWLIPFLAYFYIKEEGRSPLLFIGLQAFYILYFIVIKQTDCLEIFQYISKEVIFQKTLYSYLISMGLDADKVANIMFTALQTTLFINCFWIYKKGLESYSKHKITASPFLIGIGGNSGVGKTTVAEALAVLFTPSNTVMLFGDDMHKWQREHKKWDKLTHLNPKANYLHKEIDCLKKLKAGRKIFRRHYDHGVGKFTAEHLLSSNNLVIFEGLHPFYLFSQRSLYDLKIFIKPALELMYHWKIIRDHEKRGYSKEKIIASIEKREKDSKKYIETQINKVDIVVEALLEKKIKNVGDKKEDPEIYYSLTLSNDVYIEPLMEALELVPSLDIEHRYIQEDHQLVILKGTCSDEEINSIAQEYVGGMEDLGINTPIWPKGLFGLLILLLVYYAFEKADNDRE